MRPERYYYRTKPSAHISTTMHNTHPVKLYLNLCCDLAIAIESQCRFDGADGAVISTSFLAAQLVETYTRKSMKITVGF